MEPLDPSPELWLDDRGIPASLQLERGSRLAGGLRRLGLAEGSVVAVLLRNLAEYADVVHACRLAGVYFCPINWHFTAAEVRLLVEDSGARVLIAEHDLLAAVSDELAAGVVRLAVGGPAVAGALAYEPWLAAQQPYDGPPVAPRGHMAYTSGTTGRPKGVLRMPFPRDAIGPAQQAMRRLVEIAFGIRRGCRALIPAPLYHSAPSTFFQQALQVAERVVLMPRFDAEELLRLIERHRIDVVYLVPIMYVRLLRLTQEVRGRHDLSSLRFVASTGAPCPPEVKQAMIDWFGPVVHETYASSEAGLVTVIGSEEAMARPGSAGRPIGDAIVRIYRDDGEPAATGEIGLIHVRQPAYPDFTYRHNDQARRAIERHGLISLGDMGRVDADGYLYVCDRASDMVISGGVNIYPAEIENRLMAHPAIADCAVFGVPDAEYGEQLYAVVEPVAGAVVEPEALRDWLKATLAAYKIPRRFEIARLPRDDNGKIAKRRLRERHWQDQQRRV